MRQFAVLLMLAFSGDALARSGLRIYIVTSPHTTLTKEDGAVTTIPRGAFVVRVARKKARSGQSYVRDMDNAIEGYADLRQFVDLHDAKAYFSRALAKSEDATDYCTRGWVHFLLGSKRRALEDLDRALELQPRYAAARSRRGEVYSRLNEFEKARIDFDQAIAIDPQMTRGHSSRGRLNLAQGKARNAIIDFSRAITLQPSSWHYRQRAHAWKALQQWDKHIADLREAVELSPGYDTNYLSLALSLATRPGANKENFLESVELLKKATSISDRYECWAALADAYARIGDYQSALESREHAIQRASSAKELSASRELARQYRRLAK